MANIDAQHPNLINAKITGALATATQFVIVGWGLSMARPFLIPVLLAVLLSFIVTPLVHVLRKLKLPDTLAILFAVIIFAIPFGLLTYALVREVQSLIVDWPTILASVKEHLANLSKNEWAIRLHLDDDLNLASLQETFVNRAGQGVAFALLGLSAVLDASSTLFLIIVFAILMVSIREQLRHAAEKIIGRSSQKVSAGNLIDEVSSLIQSFLLARFIIVVVVAGLAAIMLMIFGVKYALLLGGILGIATLIPNIGFIIGMIPGLVVSVGNGHSAGSVFLLFIAYMALALFEANVLTPKLVGGKLNINSLFAFLGLFAGGLVWGVGGMLLSIPLLGIVRICMSISPETQPWTELLIEREDQNLMQRLMRTTIAATTPPSKSKKP